ncbi:hypothetical protein [Kibdelosporangium philippinense]|uniref:hypothetical protein n=1 Tax=Kibdelosporangium philippinense TaxID=211113 RepID=UPI00361D9CED
MRVAALKPPRTAISRCRNVYFGVSERWTHRSATVDTLFRNGGHASGRAAAVFVMGLVHDC